MNAAEDGFNLIDEPWLPARTDSGDGVELSLLDVFRQAPRLSTVQGELPTQTFALVRLLLAVLHRAVDGPADMKAWKKLWHADDLPVDAIAGYLEAHRPHFDLFHPETPFFQVPGIQTSKNETSELTKLIADVPNNAPFFTTRLNPEISLSCAEAARWLVHCQAFDFSGIKSGAVDDQRTKGGRGYPIGTGWAGRLGGILLEGSTVKETLLLNLISSDTGRAAYTSGVDLPSWEREPAEQPGNVGPERPTGPVDLFTWQSRRIRLVRTGDRVTRVLICLGDALPQHNRHVVEPMSLWRRSKPQEKKLGEPLVYMARKHDPEKAVWRGLQSMLPGAVRPQDGEAADSLTAEVLNWSARLTNDDVLPAEQQVRIRTIGMEYGSQESVVDDVLDDVLALNAYLLGNDAGDLIEVVLGCVRDAEDAAWALGKLALNLAQAAGKVPPAKPGMPDPQSVSDRARALERAYGQLDPAFRHWIATLGPDTEVYEAQAHWHRTAEGIIRRLATDLQRQITPTAWAGRKVNGQFLTASHAAIWFERDLRKALRQAHQSVEQPTR